MTRLQHMICLLGSAAALFLSTSGCSNYTYFNVHVKIDPAIDGDPQARINHTSLVDIAACGVFVKANGNKIEYQDLVHEGGATACPSTKTPLDVGTMDYSTAASSGKLQFVVNMWDLGHALIAQGSVEGAVNPGQILSLDLTAEQCSKTTCDTGLQ
jgi:hypothetical protein